MNKRYPHTEPQTIVDTRHRTNTNKTKNTLQKTNRTGIKQFSLNIFYLLKYSKRIRHKLNKLMKSSPTYNKKYNII